MKTIAFSKTYSKRVVLNLPELELPEGQITAVIGPNGSGKSTFAKILAGIERADEKSPVLSGLSVGYLPQKSFPFRMSTEKNILTNGSDRARAARLMKALELEGLAGQSAKKLSGGEYGIHTGLRRSDLGLLPGSGLRGAPDHPQHPAGQTHSPAASFPERGRADRAGRDGARSLSAYKGGDKAIS